MYDVERNFLQKLKTERPVLLLAFINESGLRVFSDFYISDDMVGFGEIKLFDGTWTLDGAVQMGANSETVLDRFACVESFGAIHETLTSKPEDLLGSLGENEVSTLQTVLINKNNVFSTLEATENILNATIEWRVHIKSEQGLYLSRFKGKVESYELTKDKLVMEARGR